VAVCATGATPPCTAGNGNILTGAVAIAAGAYHTCALLSDGSAKCWGENQFGQLGNGSTTDTTTPVAVCATGATPPCTPPFSTLNGAVAIAAGGSKSDPFVGHGHTCALLSDGSAQCWGENGSGQLGNGTTTNSALPVTVSTVSNGVAIAAGWVHTCVLLSDGTARCWGYNANGGLGDGTTTQRLTGVVVVLDVDGDAVSDASDNCLHVVNSGQQNADNQIGNGKGIPGHDKTVPNSGGDLEGDACETDGDADNDGIPDGSDPDPGGDITYDDNNNGVMCPADTADDGPSWDSNCDGKLDGWVGACGSTSADADTDGLKDAWENCKWGTNPNVIDSDGDTLGDCKEAADVDGNEVVNFPGDVIAYAKAILLSTAAFGQDGDFDIDGNNALNFPGDVIQEAKFGLIAGLCK